MIIDRSPHIQQGELIPDVCDIIVTDTTTACQNKPAVDYLKAVAETQRGKQLQVYIICSTNQTECQSKLNPNRVNNRKVI